MLPRSFCGVHPEINDRRRNVSGDTRPVASLGTTPRMRSATLHVGPDVWRLCRTPYTPQNITLSILYEMKAAPDAVGTQRKIKHVLALSMSRDTLLGSSTSPPPPPAPVWRSLNESHASSGTNVATAISILVKQEDRTIRELETHWKKCLDSLSRRVRTTRAAYLQVAPIVTVEAGSGRHRLGRAGGLPNKEEGHSEKTGVPESRPTTLGAASAPSVKQPDHLDVPNALLVNTGSGEGRRSSRIAAAAANVVAKEFVGRLLYGGKPPIATGGTTVARASDTSCRRHFKDSPGVSSTTACDSGAAEARVWLDRTLLKVGARVPWGRRHRGRFAKVSCAHLRRGRRM